MSYKVIRNFYDKKDTKGTKGSEVCYKYTAGDTFPRKGKRPKKERIEELMSKDNAAGYPVIEEVKNND